MRTFSFSLTSSLIKIFARLALLLGAMMGMSAAEMRRDLVYGEAGGERLLLDASVPDGEGPFPIAILVHGGGWSGGDKAGTRPTDGADITPWFDPLTRANFTWFSINYRLAPKHRWPACFDDVQTAIRWVKEHAAEFKGDPQRIVLFGHSAGGQLACLTGLAAAPDVRVQAVVGFAAVTDPEFELPVRGGLSTSLQALFDRPKEITPESLALLRAFAPIEAVKEKPAPPPFLLVQGDADKTVALQQSLNFQSRLRSVGAHADLLVIPGAGHRLANWRDLAPDYPDRMIAWIRTQLEGRDQETNREAPRPIIRAAQANDAAQARPLRLWYRQPATAWTEALPVGNGRLGAMVFGGLAEERLQLNEDTLWTGAPHAYHHEGAVNVLPKLRELLWAGAQKEAEDLAMREFMSVPLRQKMYQPLADLLLQFPGHEHASDYERELDLDAAIARVRYRVGETTFSRETYASHPDQLIVEELKTDRPGALRFALRLGAPHAAATVRVFNSDTLLLLGRVQDDGLRFATQVKVTTRGGTVRASATGIEVEGADSAVVRIATATSFKNFRDISGDPEALTARTMAAAEAFDAAQLRERHVADHRALFRRVSLDLGTSPAGRWPTDERLRAADKSADPELATLMFQYGRYLLIASSRPGDQPANLQGIWNDRTNPPWGSKYTVNINTEMNYWPADVANLAECAVPLWDLIDDLMVSGRETARAHYGARGWVLHHNTDLWRGTAPINASNHGIWPT
ncbi:MAG TPA: alpha/beta fold hydrolase, partial [Opitutus sp.]|nr:alpha/beta fold hydrolase [Opitutus sp.]